MRLSQLKSLVTQIEAARLSDNLDPEVRFTIERSVVTAPIGPKESTTFVDFDLSPELADQPVAYHRVVDIPARHEYIPVAGDFSIPLVKVDYYSADYYRPGRGLE